MMPSAQRRTVSTVEGEGNGRTAGLTLKQLLVNVVYAGIHANFLGDGSDDLIE